MKYCPGCDRTKRNKDFAKDRCKASGLQSRCRACAVLVRELRRERDQDKQRERRANNREAANALCREYHKRNRKKRLAAMKVWQKTDGNSSKATERWRKNNPEAARVLNQARRFRKANAEGQYTVAEWKAVCVKFGNVCAYCCKTKKLTVHHVVPLARGGSNYIKNIVPACQSCNSSIGTKIVKPEVCHS